MTINLSTTVLSGLSQMPPEIDGDSLFGTAVVWADAQHNGAVTMAFSGSTSPYAPVAIHPGWSSFDTPAVAIATDWEAVFVAFTDRNGFVQLATSDDGWIGTQTISQGGVGAGPALAYSSDLLYIAWPTSTNQLAFATCDRNGRITTFQSNKILTSRPTICAEDPNRIYVLCGGTVQQGPAPIKIYLSLDGGETFGDVATQSVTSFGPPSLAILDQFYLAWADGQTSQLRLAQTADLAAFTPMNYDVGCHGGGPALIPVVTIPDVENPASWVFSLSSGWTTGSGDANNHHVTVGSFGPLTVSRARTEKQRRQIARMTAPRAPNPCPDPLTVYNPATGKCVPRGGCLGGCVLSSFTRSPGGPLFNPIAYAWCVIQCESKS
jgi:hypothetical protein